MRRLLPTPSESVDLSWLFDRSQRVGSDGRPWLMGNMVMSVDGAHALEGRSGGLGSPADHTMFHALRAACDAVLVAAGTARIEGYRRPSTSDDELRGLRSANGLDDAPALYLLSRVMDLPTTMPLRTGAGTTPVVLHPAGADRSQVDTDGLALRGVATSSDGKGVDLSAALASVAADGHGVVLCEGGPSLLGELQRAGLLDELFVSISPIVAGGSQLGLLGQGEQTPTPLRLQALHEADGMLLADYVVERPTGR